MRRLLSEVMPQPIRLPRERPSRPSRLRRFLGPASWGIAFVFVAVAFIARIGFLLFSAGLCDAISHTHPIPCWRARRRQSATVRQ